MNSLNSILLEGRLTADPELKLLENGSSVCNFSIASNRYYKAKDERKEEVSFFRVVVWNGLGNSCKEFLTKGRGVRVVGRLKQDRWIDPEGINHSEVKIVAEHVDFKPKTF